MVAAAAVTVRAMRARRTRAAACLLGLLLLAGCASSPDLKQVSLPVPQPSPAPKPTAAQRENARILASYGGAYENPKLQSLIEQTVAKLVAASERPELKYRVTLLNSPAINAFALPNGSLYVTRGLVALANDKAELASVLAHEMGHVIARHAAIREEQARQAAIISHVVSDVLTDPNAGALALAKSKLTLASFSRAQEFEADGIGVGMSARAGFDAFGASRFLASMQRNAELRSGQTDPRAIDFLSSHPGTADRVKNALANARQYSAPGGGIRDHAEYLDDLNDMVYGEDQSEGFVRGRRFVHPKLGFTFTAPPGFTLDNTAQAVLGLKEGGGEAMRLDVVSVPAEQPLTAYLKSGWMDKVDPASIEDITINGFPAATATAGGDNWSFRIYAVRFGSDVYRFIFATKSKSAQIDRQFRDSVMTFRRLSLQESSQIRPLRLQIVTVADGDTPEKFAQQMAVPDRALDTFRVLNGLGPNDKLTPGTKVKIVVE